MKKTILIILSFPITLVLYILLFSGNIKYSEEIVINANIDTVSALFDNPYNMKEYMDGIESYTVLSGKIREVGAKAELIVSYVEENEVISIVSNKIIPNISWIAPPWIPNCSNPCSSNNTIIIFYYKNMAINFS